MNTDRQNLGLHRFVLFAACCTAFLIFVGGLVTIQLTLGALTVWTAKGIIPTTAHVVTGALVLGTSFLLTLRAYAMLAETAPDCRGAL
ncbi:MAG TPA: hypothetical protein VER98_12610 [Terriglobia bacterium]|nr:hypothetical protein [Terriglobia bacterium]